MQIVTIADNLIKHPRQPNSLIKWAMIGANIDAPTPLPPTAIPFKQSNQQKFMDHENIFS